VPGAGGYVENLPRDLRADAGDEFAKACAGGVDFAFGIGAGGATELALDQ
jgi:hypothetical protein